MDFVEGFSKVGGKSVALIVVDRFSKYAHFIALGHPPTRPCLLPKHSLGVLFSFMDFLALLSVSVISFSRVIFV
jgi:hypothetical protein